MEYNIALITSRFNSEITSLLQSGVRERLAELHRPLPDGNIFVVPGAVEIPVVAAALAKSGKYDAIIACGAVVRGETSHYEYVCSQVSYGCQKIAIEWGIPVIFGVLTTDTEEQALDRCGGKHGHKGRDSVDTAIEMIELLKAIREKS